MRPSLATDRIGFGFWLNISFVVNYRGAFRSIVAIASDLLTSKVEISSESQRCLCRDGVYNPDNMQDRACAALHSRWAGSLICGPSRIIATWFSYCSINPLRLQSCIYLQSDLSCLYKLKCNIFNHHNHHERLYLSLHRPAPAIRHLAGCDSWWRQAAEPASWLCNDLSIPRAPENVA